MEPDTNTDNSYRVVCHDCGHALAGVSQEYVSTFTRRHQKRWGHQIDVTQSEDTGTDR